MTARIALMDLKETADYYRRMFGLFKDNEWNLDPQKIMEAWVMQESGWNPYAVRFEPAFYRRYIPDNLKESNPTEAMGRAFSYGLLQMMGQTAREQGFAGKYLPELFDPKLNLRICSKYLLSRFEQTNETWTGALAAYNGGLGGNTAPPFRNQFYVNHILNLARG